MRKIYAALLASGVAGSTHAQNIINVLFDPDPIHACELVEMTMIGNYPSPNYSPLFYAFDPGTFTLDFNATGTGTSPQTPFNQAFPPVGPLAEGSHTFTANLILDGVVVDSWTTTLDVLPPPAYSAGTSTYGNEVCPGAVPIPLISFLAGSPTPGGEWIDPFGSPHGNNLVPGVDPAGYYSYQFLLQPPCTPLFSEVEIVYLPANDPGFSNTLETCITGDPVDLFNSILGTPYSPGTWTAPGGASFSGMYDPDINDPGIYTYTVPAIAPCTVGASSTITVTEVPLSNAGVGGTVEICYDDTSLVLNTELTGSPSQAGTWFDPSGIAFGYWEAEYDASNPDHYPGTYTYVVVSANCPADTAYVNVVEVGPPCNIGYAEHEGMVGSFELFPNPANEQVLLEIQLNDAIGECRLELLNVDGRVIHSEILTPQGSSLIHRTLQLGYLPGGAYLVRLWGTSGSIARRLMLQ